MSRRSNQYGLKQDERGIWHADFSVAGKRIQRSTATQDRASAEEWCAALAARLWRERKLGEAPTLKWEEGAALWVKAKDKDGKRDLPNDMDKARIIGAHLNGLFINKLTTKIVDDALDCLEDEREWSNTSRNRYRSFVIGVLNFLRKKGYNAPLLDVERRREPDGLVVWIGKPAAVILLGELPLHLNRMVEFSLATGLRQANVTGLLWQNVDLERRIAWVWAEDAKGKRHLSVPLNDTAIRILLEAKSCKKHGHRRLCFTYYGAAVEQPANSAWFKAIERAKEMGAEIPEEFTWHCLRHTWATWHVMGLMSADGRPTPLEVLQKLGGWRDIRMVQRYAHLARDYTAQYAGDPGLTVAPSPQKPELKVVA